MDNNLGLQFKAARRANVPLIAIRTPDPAATMEYILELVNGQNPPAIAWNIVEGMASLNGEVGDKALKAAGVENAAIETGNPVEALIVAKKLPSQTLLFFLNGNRYASEASVAQAMWNLRDDFKSDFRTLVLLCPDINLPMELANDCLVLDELLPDEQQLRKIITDTHEAGGIESVPDEVVVRCVEALSGLASFPAEQALAMSLQKSGVDIPALWERKRQMIEQTPGLSVYRGNEKFSDIGGCNNVKGFLTKVLTGRKKPRAVCFLDEIEKSVGSAGDTSGVSQSMLGTLLSFMQDFGVSGVICIGPPGAAKSAVAKACGNEGGIPTIQFDLTGMKGSLVGESEQRLRMALKVVQAVSQGNALFIATCLDGDTLIQCANGDLKEISTIKNTPIVSYDECGDTEVENIYNLYTRKARVCRVETSAPDIFATNDHRFLKWFSGGMREVCTQDLSVGDYLPIPRKPQHGELSTISPDTAYMLGYTCGDGNISAGRLQWSEQSFSLIAELKRIAYSLFSETLGETIRKDQDSTILYSKSGGELYKTISQYPEVCCVGSELRAVPSLICKSESCIISAFLSGLFDADGCVTRQGYISISIVSRKLRDQVYMLLRRFGIMATCGTYKPKLPRQTVHRLSISGDNAVKFEQFIGFRSDKKSLKSSLIKPRPTEGKRGRSVDMVPVDKEYMKFCGYKQSVHGGPRNNNKRMERSVLLAVRNSMYEEGLEVSYIDNWLAYDWVRVRRLSLVEGVQQVFDIQVTLNHTFCANGILVHNCNSIASLPPELRRRFNFGTFFFDLPGADERDKIWNIYVDKYELTVIDQGKIPDSAGWTGAEIKMCCDIAWRLDISLLEAASYIVPVSIAAASTIDRLRAEASGRFISASKPGLFSTEKVSASKGRKIDL